MDGSGSTSLTKSEYSLHPRKLHEDFSHLSGYLLHNSPAFTRLPFQAQSMAVTKDKQNFIIGDLSGRLAMCSRKEKEILQEKHLQGCSITCLCVSHTGTEIFLGGEDGKIHIVSPADFSIIDTFTAAEQRINHIRAVDAEHVIVSSDHHTVLEWHVRDRKSRVLHTHQSSVRAMDCCAGHIVSGSTEGLVLVTDSNLNEVSRLSSKYAVTCVRMTEDYLAIALGHLIQIVNVKGWQMTFKIHAGIGENVISMDICDDKLVTGSRESSLKVWKLQEWGDEVSLSGHSGEITSIVIIHSIIHSLSTDFKIRASNIPQLPTTTNFKCSTSISDLIHNSKLNTTYTIDKNNEVHEFPSNKKLHTCPNPRISWTFTNFDTILVLFYRKNEESMSTEVCLINLDSKATVTCFELRTSSVPTVCSATDSAKYLITGEMFRITVWKSTDGNLEYIFRSHNANITAMVTSGDHLFAGDASGCIKHYNLLDFTETASFNEIDQLSIKDVKVTKDLALLFSVSAESCLTIWSIKRKSAVHRITMELPIKQLHFSADNQNFFLNFGKSVEIWSIQSLSSYFTMKFRNENACIVLSNADASMVCAFHKYIKVLENPLKANSIGFYGDSSHSHRFVEYISTIFAGNIPKYDSDMNNFIVLPYHINILHIYAYFNLSSSLGRSISQGASFYPSKLGYTALNICLDRSLGDSLDSLLQNFLPRLQQNPINFYYLGNTLAKLNTYSPGCLHQLYELGFRKSLDPTMPQFCEDSTTLPILKESPDIFMSSDIFLPADKFRGEEKAIEFVQSYFKLSTETGSQFGVNFIKSLLECKNLEIYTTLFVKTYIEDKWSRMRWIHYADSVLYLVYLVALFAWSSDDSVRWLLIVPFAINQILLIFEFFQMAAAPLIYFTGFLNYLDMFRSVLFNLYCAVVYFEYHEDRQEALLILTITLSLIRGFGYFRVMSATRGVMYLIIEVVYQLWAFIFVTIYTIVSLYVISDIVVKNYDFIESETFKLEWLMLFFLIFINPLIILNLFISIIGNALEKIKDERVVRERQELTEMIFEAEVLFFWKRKQNQEKFLHLCKGEQDNSVTTNSISEKLRYTAEKTEELIKAFQLNSSEIEKLKESFAVQFEDLEVRASDMLTASKN